MYVFQCIYENGDNSSIHGFHSQSDTHDCLECFYNDHLYSRCIFWLWLQTKHFSLPYKKLNKRAVVKSNLNHDFVICFA